MKRLVAILMALAMLLSLCACGSETPASSVTSAPDVEETEPPVEAQPQQPEPESYESYDIRSYASQWVYNEQLFVGAKYVDIPYYALENVVYCTNPVEEEYQYINIYVPACYMTTDEAGNAVLNEMGIFGVMGEDDSTLMYMSNEAPIVYLNTISGYAAGIAPKIGDSRMGNNAGYCYQFLEQGCILVTVSARGRTSETGTVPAGLVDLKAGLRWLSYNDQFMAGDANKIVSIGVSAGGGMSTMLGTSGNSDLYDSYLEEIGALEGSDAVWASVCYCPITNLPFADGAYWWQAGAKDGDDFDAALTRALRDSYIAYMQSLGFDLGDDGVSGAFYEGFLSEFENALQYKVDSCKSEDDIAAFISETDPEGSWLSWDAENGVQIASIADFVANYWDGKMAGSSAAVFDVPDCGSMEGQVYGGEHFSWLMVEALKAISGDYPEAADLAAEYEANMSAAAGLYDPMTFIGQDNSDMASHFRFNIGSEDTNTTQALAWTVYNALLASEPDVAAEYAILYGIGHQTVEYDPYDLISWIYEKDLGVKPAYDNIKKLQTVEKESAGTVQSYEEVAGTYTLDEVNGAGMEVHWTLELKTDGTYSLSETGPVSRTYTGKYVAIDGNISCGPINEEEGPRGDAFGDGWISVWTLNANGTCAHGDLANYVDPDSAGGAAPVDVTGTYTLDEVNAAGMEIHWTLELKADGTYALSEEGVVSKTYTGVYGVVGEYVSCGPINEADGPRGQAFGEAWESVWTVDKDAGTCQYVDLANYTAPGAGGAAASVAGTYTLDEVNAAGMEIHWTLQLNEDMTYALSETGVVEKTYTGIYGVVGEYVSCGPINEADGPRGQAFGEAWESVWTLNDDGTCQYVDLANYTAPTGAAAGGEAKIDVVGIYTLDEVNAAGMEIHWTLELRADGTYVLSEEGVVAASYTGTYTADGTTVSCGPINEDNGPRGAAFGEAWDSEWIVDPDNGTCEYIPKG